MEHLTEKYWCKFKDTEKNDGKLFEKFIKELLAIEYPNYNFMHTKQTRDGAKDITSSSKLLFGKEISLWMECKNYNDKLSFNDISSTLLMAYLEDAKQLIFFSYSKVNREFYKYIARYTDRTKIDVKIFDDVALEQLILKNAYRFENFNYYFPSFEISNNQYLFSNNELNYDYVLKTQNDIKANMPLFLDLNEEIELDLYIKNSSSKSIQVKTKLEAENFSNYFEIISSIKNEFEYVLQPFSANVFKYKIVIKKFRKGLKLPNIILNIDNKEIKLEIKRKYDCRWLAETKLIGKNHRNQLNLIKKHLSTNFNTSIITLCGKSGTGKSRILKEIGFFVSRLEKKTFNFDTDLKNNNAKKFLKTLISELDMIPDFDESYKPTKINFLTNIDKDKAISYQIMYDKNYKIENHIMEISDYLVRLIKNNDVAIIIDNAQNLDEATLTLIENIVIQLKHQKSSSAIILSFNSNKIYLATKEFQICKKMQLLASELPKQFVFEEIFEFSKEEAKEYIKECLTCNANERLQYEHTIDQIVTRIGCNPFFLRNYLIYLYQNQIIERSEYGCFYILDFKQFQNSFIKLPTEILILIEERENLFYKNLSFSNKDLEIYHHFFYALSLCKIITLELFCTLFNREVLEYLLDTGFIKCNENNITFSHQIYDEYFSNKFPVMSLPSAFAETIINRLETLALTEDMFFQYFILKYIANKIDNSLFISAIEKVLSNDIEVSFYRFAFNIIDKYIRCKKYTLEYSMKIQLYNLMFSKTQYVFGINQALRYAKTIYDDFIINHTEYINVIDILFKTLKEYLTSQLNIGDYQSSLDCSKIIIDIFTNNLKYFDNKERFIIQLYNCQSMAYHHMDMLDNAIKSSNKAIELSKRIGDLELLSTSWRERGNIFYHSSKSFLYKKEICECWKNAYNIAFASEEDFKKFDKYFCVSSCMKFVLANLINNETDNLQKIVKYIFSNFEKTSSLYYEINMRYLVAIYYICVFDIRIIFNQTLYTEISKIINEAIDYSGIYGNYDYYAAGFYLKSLLSYLSSDLEKTYDNFLVVLNLINRNVESSNELIKWNKIISDIKSFIDQNQKLVPEELISLLEAYTNESDLDAILKIKNQKLAFPNIF